MNRQTNLIAPWLLGMNPEQAEVIHHGDGPCVLMAVAGAGKTRALVHRVARMVGDGIPARRICAVTFSKKAADEMNERLDRLGVEGARIGTWHSLCLEILQKGHSPWATWNVGEEGDGDYLLSEALGYRHLDWKDADKGEVKRYIARCKANLAEPGSPGAAAIAKRMTGPGHIAEQLQRAYKVFQVLVEERGILLFDDFLLFTHRHLSIEQNRLDWAGRWSYFLHDEAQDENVAQRTIAEMLCREHRNYLTVGDCNQCIPEGEVVSTPEGYRAIETIKVGDYVHSVKRGKTYAERVVRTSCNKKSEAFEFEVELPGNGKTTIRATAEHVMFAAVSDPGGSFVYLMYRPDMGYRVGVSRTAGHNGKHFLMRTQQEHAERLWVLRWFETYAEAAELEAEFAYAFGIPREPFVSRPGIWSSPEAAKRLFEKFGENGKALLDACGMDFERPNYFAKTTGRGRVAVNLLMGTKDGHRVEVDTGVVDGKTCALLGMKPTTRGTMRIRRNCKSLREARALAAQYATALGGYVVERLSGTGSKRRTNAVRATGVHRGMEVPVIVDGKLTVGKVLAKRTVLAGLAYDLEVENLGNFIVGGVVVHNSIYGFRGSDPQHLAAFEKEWGARVILMNRNYRSGRAIVEAANAIIRPGRYAVEMVAEREEDGEVRVERCDDPEEEGEALGNLVEETLQRGGGYQDVVALYRQNSHSRALEEALLKRRIPYVVAGGVSFYQRKEVRDLLAYLRVATGRDGDGKAVRRCINTPFRYLGKAFVEKVEDELDERTTVLEAVERAAQQEGIQARQRAAADEWAGIVLKMQTLHEKGDAPGAMLLWLVNATKYLQWLTRDQGEESVETSHVANVRELLRVAERFDDAAALLDYVDETEKAAARQRRSGQGGQRVLLMSIHRSKGLEFPVVFVAGCNEKLIPHAFGDVEEERRLLYVAVTRARDVLVLSHLRKFARAEGVKEAAPSRFLVEAGLVSANG